MTPPSPYYQIAKVAHILKISRPLALRLVKDGELPAVKTPQGLRVDPRSLAQWVEGQIVSCSLHARSLAKEPQNQ